MSILINSPIEKTKEEIIKSISNSIRLKSSKTYNDLVNIQKSGINMIWKNPNITPQEIIDGLGEDALKAFQFHGELTDMLVTISASANIEYVPALPTNAFTIDNVGKITVLGTPYIP